MAKKSKWQRVTTLPGTAKWPHLVTPDTTFNKNGVYTTKLTWEPEDFDEMKLKEVIDAEVDKMYDKTTDGMKPKAMERVFKQYPYGDDLDDEKEETGKIAVNFKSNASFKNGDGEVIKLKPALFDAAGNQIRRRINIGNGSILCVNCTVKPYAMKAEVLDSSTGKKMEITNCGVTLYINGVQIRELVEYGASAESMGFETDGEALPSGDDFEPGDEETPADGEGDF
jgi:hypothetical protein